MKIINSLIAIVAFISLISCDDILEKDISNDIIQIISPTNNEEVHGNSVNFRWNNLTGATKYRIQVFSSNASILIDSLVTENKLDYSLTEGDYSWRVRAENNAYMSVYSNSSNFAVVQTTDLTNQTVIFTSPSDNFYTNNPNVILSWQRLTAATSYSFELIKVTNGNSIINQQSNLTANTLTLSSVLLNADAEYSWKVKAVNSTSESVYSSRSLFLDTIIPNQPINNLPANNSTQTIGQQLTFSWTVANDSGIVQSPISYDIEFSNDLSFSSIILKSTTTTLNYQKTFTSSGDYYWRIKAKDQAGNVSATSSSFKFTIN